MSNSTTLFALTNPIANSQDICPRITRASVIRAVNELNTVDQSGNAIEPHIDITFRCFGPGNNDVTAIYCDRTVSVYDNQASGVLCPNVSPQSYSDAVATKQVSITGAYTYYAGIFDANTTGTGTGKKRLAALQAAILAKAGAADGLVTSEFAGG